MTPAVVLPALLVVKTRSGTFTFHPVSEPLPVRKEAR